MTREQAEQYFLGMVNRDRAAHGLGPVKWDAAAAEAGRRHAANLMTHGFTAHIGVDGSVPDALATTRRMHEITLGENPRWSVPVLEFQGTPTGIDVSKVCRTGILPQINTGMAGRLAGVGQVGAGLVTPPAELFPKALRRLAELASG